MPSVTKLAIIAARNIKASFPPGQRHRHVGNPRDVI